MGLSQFGRADIARWRDIARSESVKDSLALLRCGDFKRGAYNRPQLTQHCWPSRARLSSNASIMANVLQIADALYAEDRDAKTLASRVAAKLESDGVTNLPLLTQENYATGRAPPGSLVRYVGMVQDMGNPEFYAPSVAVNGTDVCVAFRDELPSGADPSDATLADRSPSSAWRRPVCLTGPRHQGK